MKKIAQRSTLVVGMILLAVMIAVPALATARNVKAEDAPTDGTSGTSQTSPSPEPAPDAQPGTTEQQQTSTPREEVKTALADRRAAVKTRLQDAKLRACQNRQKAITTIMHRIADRGSRQLNLFGTIADRTEAFYVKQGKTLSTYDQLVADVVAKKADAQAAVESVTSKDSSFTCDGNDPKGIIGSFKDSLKSEIKALQEYRTSVKNLIVGVKSVQSTATISKETN